MELGMVGLGKMGGNMARRLLQGGHRVFGFDVDPQAVAALAQNGGTALSSLAELVVQLPRPRSVWSMLPPGSITEAAIQSLASLLDEGDTLIDGGNSNYKDSQRRSALLETRGLRFIDVGMSGGIWGLAGGYSVMVGGATTDVERHRPLFETLAPAPDRGWGHVGPPGAGHFVKMIHNGVEYGLMQAYAEGFDILKAKTESISISPRSPRSGATAVSFGHGCWISLPACSLATRISTRSAPG